MRKKKKRRENKWEYYESNNAERLEKEGMGDKRRKEEEWEKCVLKYVSVSSRNNMLN